MKRKYWIFLLLLIFGGEVEAQNTYYSLFSYDRFIPQVAINDNALSLQKSLLPKLYINRSVAKDMRWVRQNDSVLTAFWLSKGDTVLDILSECSGIEWKEPSFDIYLVRYYPSLGSYDPFIVPFGGIYRGSTIEAMPSGNRMIINLVYQLAKRMLAQVYRSNDSLSYALEHHPLMKPTPFRFDNLAMLLALTTCQNIIGIDSTMDAFRSAFFKNKLPGRIVLEKYLLNNWVLTPEHSLLDWVLSEPFNSPLVIATRPPLKKTGSNAGQRKKYIEGLPLKGRLGFSVKLNDRNQMVVDTIDVYRLAYASGLRANDIIRRVNGIIVRNQKRLIENILNNLDNGGATVEIIRNGQWQEVVIQPMEIPSMSEDSLYSPPAAPDSIINDSIK
ncbi:MAG: PDZ domain-containing protein [FCB group bacterium]|nr:PDZ domain-containing protein [FCB group bacterium]